MIIDGVECRITQDHQHYYSVWFCGAILAQDYSESKAVEQAEIRLKHMRRVLSSPPTYIGIGV